MRVFVVGLTSGHTFCQTVRAGVGEEAGTSRSGGEKSGIVSKVESAVPKAFGMAMEPKAPHHSGVRTFTWCRLNIEYMKKWVFEKMPSWSSALPGQNLFLAFEQPRSQKEQRLSSGAFRWQRQGK